MSDTIRERWKASYFNDSCSLVRAFIEVIDTVDDIENYNFSFDRDRLSHLYEGLIQYSIIDHDEIYISLFARDYFALCDVRSYYNGFCDGFKDAAETISEKETFCKILSKAVGDNLSDSYYDSVCIRCKEWAENKERLFKEQIAEITQYCEKHKGEKIVRKRMSEELNIPYDVCCSVCRDVLKIQ